MILTEFVEPVIPPAYDQIWITAIRIGIAVWLGVDEVRIRARAA